MPELPSGTVTFVFTDIEGSTRLLEALGEGYGEALTAHRAALRDAFAAHGGVEVDNQGDAFFFAFPDAREAVRAAAAGRDALARGPVRVRIGLHTGTPSRTNEGYFGRDVNVGARVAASAHGGQVVVTKATRDLLDDADLRDLGEHRVKDFDEPIWIYQLGEELFPPLKTISNTNLPHPASSFVGREREVREVEALVRKARLVTLTGPGGSGKTRLSIEAGSELVGEFKNGVFWIGLATAHDPGGVLPAVAQTLGAQGDLAGHIGERELLLVIDNLEQVVACAPELATLVEACPNLRLIVTSRELLRVRGEVEYEVLPLADPDAVELFCLRAGIEASAAVEELCRRLDNMPLALELAAARTKALTPEQILERLGERLDLFQGGRDAEERQKTLRATIEWSHDLLSPDEQRLFAQLGVFVGGCTLDSAEAVTDADLDTIQSLVEKSLLRRTDDRFWMLETIRDYAVERLTVSGEVDPRQRRHAEHFLAVAESANLSAESTGRESPELVRPEADNIRAAIDWAVNCDLELAFRLAIAMEQFWVMNDAFEGVRRIRELLEQGPHISPVLRARSLRVLGETSFIAGDFEQSASQAHAALAAFERLGDERAVAVVLHRLSVDAVTAQDFARARRLLEESLAICRRLPNPKLEADAIRILGWVEQCEGNPERALELFEEAAKLCERIGYTWIQASTLLGIAELCQELGRPEIAEARAIEALRLSWQLVDRRSSVYALASLVSLAAAQGDIARAGRLWGAIEAEESRAPLGNWDQMRDEYAAEIVTSGDAEFENARTAGHALTLNEAVDYALAGRNTAPSTSR
jgi:predicted ATPase